MRFLVLLAVLAGCKSAPVQYEMIEVQGGEKMQDMYRSIRDAEQGSLPQVLSIDSAGCRPIGDLHGSRRADSRASRAVLGSGRIVSPRDPRQEPRRQEGTANESTIGGSCDVDQAS
jgi:hypothetical protein